MTWTGRALLSCGRQTSVFAPAKPVSPGPSFSGTCDFPENRVFVHLGLLCAGSRGSLLFAEEGSDGFHLFVNDSSNVSRDVRIVGCAGTNRILNDGDDAMLRRRLIPPRSAKVAPP